MKSPKSKISQVFRGLFLISPLILFFSYYPIISFGSTDSMNLELSLPLIWLALFDLSAVILYFKDYQKFPSLTKKLVFFLLFPLYLTISLLWTPNLLRGILTVGIIWLIFLAIFLAYKLSNHLKPLKSSLIKSIFISAIIISLWCWLQSILDLIGLNRSATLICGGCTTATFGFPHPNGFAVEPQFMGNLLLAPTLLAVFYWYQKPSWKRLLALFFLATTLFFTFSRGAIYSFGLAIILMLIILIIKQKSARPLLTLPILLCSFAFSLNAQGLMAAVSSTNDTYLSGITKSIDQLTLGIFNLRIEQPSSPEPTPDSTAEPPEETNPTTTTPPATNSAYDGYVEVSTTGRLKIAAASLKVWSKTPENLLFGVGLGGSGRALFEAGELDYPAEIGQNEYCTILLETGILGALLLIFALVVIFRTLPKHTEYHPLLFALLLAYAVSIFFFSGITNALHLYLAPIFWPPFIKKATQK